MTERAGVQTAAYAEGIVLAMKSGGPGQPGFCPACQAPGHLDVIVPARNSQFESCSNCGCEWTRALDYEGAVELIKLPTD